MYRLILVAILPVIAVTLYVEGQRYEPAVMRFQVEAQLSATTFFPKQADGLTHAGQLRRFGKDNLYEYLNGHAEYFIKAGFVSLTIADYFVAGANAHEPSVVAEIYDMGRPLHAFGVFADESDNSEKNEAQVGMMGFSTAQGISFMAGQYYVKLNVFKPDTPAMPLAKAIDKNIGAQSESFTLFSKFPELGQTLSTRFIKHGYRGLDFFNNVLERQYQVNGQTVSVAMINGKDEEIALLGETFLTFLKDSQIEYGSIENGKRKIYKINDPYEGDWYLVIKNDFLYGVYGGVNPELLNAF